MKKRLRRGEGFAGQHLVVLPEPICAAARRHPLLRGLLVTDAGYFPQAEGHHVERPQGAPTHLLILCLRGLGWVRTGGTEHVMQMGNFCWLPAGQAHAYGTSQSDPWTICWAHFAGDEASAWHELLGSGQGTVPPDRIDEVGLDRVHAALERGYSTRDLVEASGALRVAMSALTRLGDGASVMRSSRERVAASIERLRRDWVRAHRLEELAAEAGLSAAHYSSLFRTLTGFAPIDFIIRLRVRHACRLLTATDLAVHQVAEASGYADPYYFTRCFRRVMGVSPRTYRKTPRG